MRILSAIGLIVLSYCAMGNPVVRGTWFGYILQGKVKLPTTLYITDDNDQGQMSGTITMTFNYLPGKVYNCQAKFSGNIDYKTYEFSLIMEEYIYYDLLPEGMKWCLGSIFGSIGREMELKKYVIQGIMRTKCTEDISDVVLLKQEQ